MPKILRTFLISEDESGNWLNWGVQREKDLGWGVWDETLEAGIKDLKECTTGNGSKTLYVKRVHIFGNWWTSLK